MNKLYCLIIMFIACRVCEGQNLVPNPSFEDTVHCPLGPGYFNDAAGWFKPTLGSTDYFNSCTGANSISTPQNFFGYQVPRTGVAYAGFCAAIPIYDSIYYSYREYAEIRLNSALQAGQNYFLSFYVSLADSVNYATDDIGAYFSVDTASSDTSYLLYAIPQIENPSGNILADKALWTEISGVYTAQGGERYLTIGNFKNSQNTDTIFVGGGSSNIFQSDSWTAYYYIDDVSVTLSTGINEQNQNTLVKVFPTLFNEKLNINVIDKVPSEIIIYDIASRKLIQQKFTSSLSLNTAQLTKGIYLYEVRNKNGVINKGKVLKD